MATRDDALEVELPLRGGNAGSNTGGNAGGNASGSTDSASEEEAGYSLSALKDQLPTLLGDLFASIVFWFLFLFVPIPDEVFWPSLAILGLLMAAWRLHRAHAPPEEGMAEVPYTCGYASSNGKAVYIVATLHISPRAPRDVETVINTTNPDVAMIELDEERLDRMRDVQAEYPPEPREEDLQAIRITEPERGEYTVFAQRALWNAERAGETLAAKIFFDKDNQYALEPLSKAIWGNFALVKRGSPAGEFSPFALKAHHAAQSGAQAVLVINHEDKLPINRLGGGTVVGDLQIALRTCNCGFPPIPVMLLSRTDGERLEELCQFPNSVQAEIEVMADCYPRRTLRRRLCQSFALIFSGIGILYGIIQCFNVEVGAEFIAAEEAATNRGIPCVCIDVDLNRFWSRLGMALIPSPCNLGKSLLSWLAFPRVLFRVLFPARGNVDVTGSMVLHAASFSCRTWLAFVLAGMCASFITSHILGALGWAGERAGESTGVVSKEDREEVQSWIMLGIYMYMLPRLYEAVAASRDETMYRSIVSKSRELGAQNLTVVVGAAHSNGILQRIRARGL